MSVFVLDQRKQPLMPCSERRARLLLRRKRAVVHRVTRGVLVGRVAVRASGKFRVGKLDGISAKYCQVVQRADGYSYTLRNDAQGGGASSPRVNAGASVPQ